MAEGATRTRSADETRERLLDATIESLIEVGYRRSSMREICERAGISRGSQLYHYPTKAKLMTSAVEHLARVQGERLEAAARKLPPGPERIALMVDLLWDVYSGRIARAFTELWTAASTDPELREALQPVDRDLMKLTIERIGGPGENGLDAATVERLFWLSVTFVRGLALDELMGGSEKRRIGLLESWKAMARDAADGALAK